MPRHLLRGRHEVIYAPFSYQDRSEDRPETTSTFLLARRKTPVGLPPPPLGIIFGHPQKLSFLRRRRSTEVARKVGWAGLTAEAGEGDGGEGLYEVSSITHGEMNLDDNQPRALQNGIRRDASGNARMEGVNLMCLGYLHVASFSLSTRPPLALLVSLLPP